MIKRSVCFFLPDPEREKRHVPAEHRRANCRVLISSPERNVFLCVCVHVLWVCCVCHCFIFPVPSSSSHSFPPSSLFSGATSFYTELSLMCAVTLAAAGGRAETHTRTQTHTQWTEITGLCMASVYSLPSQHHPSPPHYLCTSAHCIRPTVHCVRFHLVRWRGRILFMGRAIWGACHMAEVIRWSTGEDMMSTTLERETQASLSCRLARLSSLHIHMLAYRRALIYTGMDAPEWDSTTGVVLK